MTVVRLTSREQQIVVLAAEGLHDKEIAARLGVSAGTVRTYLRRAYARNNFGGRVELVVAWLRMGPDPARTYSSPPSAPVTRTEESGQSPAGYVFQVGGLLADSSMPKPIDGEGAVIALRRSE